MAPMPLPVSGSSNETDTVGRESIRAIDEITSGLDSSASSVKPITFHTPASNSIDTCHQVAGCNGKKQFESEHFSTPADDCCKETEPDANKPLKYKLPRYYKVSTSVHKLSHFDHATLTGSASKPRTKSVAQDGFSRKPNECIIEKNGTSFGKASSLRVDEKAHSQPQLLLDRSGPAFQGTIITSCDGRSSNVPVMKQHPPLAGQGSFESNGNAIVSKENLRCNDQEQGGQEPNLGSSSNSQLPNQQCHTAQGGPLSHMSNGNGVSFKNNYRDNLRGQGGLPKELTRGPRFLTLSNPSARRENLEKVNQTIKVDNYNSPDFQTEYKDARFFVIKSYGEVDVQKSIKYHVWSSTRQGNDKLDAAFHEASEIKCPIFLFFSVNCSGQFIGVAEMVGRVDYKKTMQFWMDDLWAGFFPLKWHIIKDVPHRFFSHIILKNNYNRCVTFTRDTQEVELEQGLEMLNIFKSFSEQTSLLDDFCYYEEQESSSRSRRNPRSFQVQGSENDHRGYGVRSLNRF